MAHLIDKYALVAEIERLWNEYKNNDGDSKLTWFVAKLENFVNTLEVKEVNLNNEYAEEIYSHLDSIKDTADRMTSGNFMHNKNAIKLSAKIIIDRLHSLGIYEKE